MKRLVTLLLALMMVLSLASCAKKDEGGDNSNGTTSTSTPDKDGESAAGNESSKADDAGDKTETVLPEGWDENRYGMYIYEVWDAEFLPDVMPAAPEGIEVDQTVFKDYKHDTMSGGYGIGPISYENYDDYREYGVSFYCTVEQLDAFFAAAEAKGFVGGNTTNREEDSWWEEVYYNESGWYMYVTFKPSTYNDEYDGFASVSLTDSVYKRPTSISGNPLPQKGMPGYDFINDCYIYTAEYDAVDFDIDDTFPTDKDYSMFLDYYGTTAEYAKTYTAELVAAGWTVTQGDQMQEDGGYYALLEKDGQYAQVDFIEYDGILQIGFASMVEFLQY